MVNSGGGVNLSNSLGRKDAGVVLNEGKGVLCVLMMVEGAIKWI
jgi:hypothetical protein